MKQIPAVCNCTNFISGVCRSNEGAGEEQHDLEVGKGRGETEPVGSPVGETSGAHPEDRPCVSPGSGAENQTKFRLRLTEEATKSQRKILRQYVHEII